MDIQKVYVRHDGTAVIKSPNCVSEKTFNAAKLKKRGKPFNVRSLCQLVFHAFLNLDVFAAKSAFSMGIIPSFS